MQRAFPAETLEQETYDYARRVAKVPAQKLRLEKLAINGAVDMQGFRTAVLVGAEFDAIFHFGPGNEEICAVQNERRPARRHPMVRAETGFLGWRIPRARFGLSVAIGLLQYSLNQSRE